MVSAPVYFQENREGKEAAEVNLPSRCTRRKAMRPSIYQVSLASPRWTREAPMVEGRVSWGCTYLLPAAGAVLDGGVGLGLSLLVEDGAAVIVRVRGRGVGDGRGQHGCDARADGDGGAAKPSCAPRRDGALEVGAVAIVDLLLVLICGGWGRCVRHDECVERDICGAAALVL